MSVVRGRPPGLAGGIIGREQGVLLVAQGLPGAEVADQRPALRCPHGVPPRRAAPFLNRRHGLSASRSPGRRALLKRPLTSAAIKYLSPSFELPEASCRIFFGRLAKNGDISVGIDVCPPNLADSRSSSSGPSPLLYL